MNVKSIILNKWVICGNCGAKLFKVFSNSQIRNIEIKCKQCKEINNVDLGGK